MLNVFYVLLLSFAFTIPFPSSTFTIIFQPSTLTIPFLVQSFFETLQYCDEWRKFTSVSE